MHKLCKIIPKEKLLFAYENFPNHTQAALYLQVDRKTLRKYSKFYGIPVKIKQKDAYQNVPKKEAIQLIKKAKSLGNVAQNFGYRKKNIEIARKICDFFNQSYPIYKNPTPALNKHEKFLKQNAHLPYRELAKTLNVCINRIVVMMKTLGIKKIPAFHHLGNPTKML